jgi:hypothetical protein
MKHTIELLRTQPRIIGFEGYFAALTEEIYAYRGQKIIVTFNDKTPDHLCIEAEMCSLPLEMDGFSTTREAMDWIDAQLAETIDDGHSDWMAYRDEHSLRSYQLV